ncbi:MAG: hypothetical protein M3Q10_17190 [Chloroflexota bacterium]|nr:hypothetical protein [Chloroflexota bacterium]
MASTERADELLRCVDPWGREIVLTAATWTLHVLPDRAPLVGNEEGVRLTLTAPQVVMRDATRDDRAVYYRRGALPAPYDHLYLKVVVDFPTAGTASTDGRVATAFPTRRFRPGEQQTWP